MTTGGAAVLGRAAAVVGTVCVAVHLVAATSAEHGGAVERAVFLAMAVACLACVRALWRHPGRGAWRSTAVMYGGMLFTHLLLLSAAAGRPAHGAGGSHGGHGGTDAGTWVGLLLAAVQVTLAGAVLASGRLPAPQSDPVELRAG